MLPTLNRQQKLHNYLQAHSQSEELRLLVGMFDDRDHSRCGKIKLSELRGILNSLEFRVHLRDILGNMRVEGDSLSFDEVVIAVAEAQRLSQRHPQPRHKHNILLEYLKNLEQYRLTSDRAEDYTEAQKAHEKISQLRSQYMSKQIERVRELQEEERGQLQAMHHTKFQKFNSAWVQFMDQYENKVFQQIQRLKETHLFEMNDLEERTRQEALQNIRPSKDVLELRAKARNLAKQKAYKEAARCKNQAEQLFAAEQEAKRGQIDDSVRVKCDLLRRKQEKAIRALLKRVEKDRGEQLSRRKSDCVQMLNKIQNLKREVKLKHSEEQRRVSQALSSRLESARFSSVGSMTRSRLRTSDAKKVQRIFERLQLYNP